MFLLTLALFSCNKDCACVEEIAEQKQDKKHKVSVVFSEEDENGNLIPITRATSSEKGWTEGFGLYHAGEKHDVKAHANEGFELKRFYCLEDGFEGIVDQKGEHALASRPTPAYDIVYQAVVNKIEPDNFTEDNNLSDIYRICFVNGPLTIDNYYIPVVYNNKWIKPKFSVLDNSGFARAIGSWTGREKAGSYDRCYDLYEGDRLSIRDFEIIDPNEAKHFRVRLYGIAQYGVTGSYKPSESCKKDPDYVESAFRVPIYLGQTPLLPITGEKTFFRFDIEKIEEFGAIPKERYTVNGKTVSVYEVFYTIVRVVEGENDYSNLQ